MRQTTGTVTFVFTDIEGSTRLLATHPEAYPAIVRRQRHIIGEATSHHGGTVVGHEGDSCFLVFPDAVAAGRAAAEAQLLLEAENWPEAASVKVRMGIHTGEAERVGDDYYGIAVHTAARVAAAAHGGQILISDTTRNTGLSAADASRDLGVHRLKDLERPLRLHQLTMSGLPSDFPPVRAIPSTGDLRTPTTTFVGREVETAEVARLLETNRVVTLLGPGGIGKTRFALHVGSVASDHFPDGIWFADLTGTDDSEAVADIIAEAVGVSVRSGGDPTSVVGDVLAQAHGLLIVDNFEHVIEAAPVVSRLVEPTEHLRVLVTSRERLRLNAERAFEVQPLPLHPDGAAVRLFCDRARAARPDFDPTPADIDAIVRICRRLDGLPLAIELAAARMRLLQTEEIAERLTRRAIGLGGGARDLHARQQTIRRTIEWSYHLLGPDEQTLLVQLAVFAGPMRVDAVEAILGEGRSDVTDVLADLVDKSLLQQRVDGAGTTRVRMLELVREFAEELLAARTDTHDLSNRHATHFARLAEQSGRAMLTDEHDRGMRRIDADYPDIVRAFEWGMAHDLPLAVVIYASMAFYFHSRGLAHTARRWEELTRSVPVDDLLAARRSIAAGYVEFGFRRLPEARDHWARAIPVLREAGDLLAEAWATMSLGATHIGDTESYEDALEMIAHGIELAGEAGSPVLVGLGFNIAGELSRVHGDDAAADAAYVAGSQVARTVDDHYREAILLGNRVYTASHRGQHELALSQGRAALELHRRHGHHNQIPWVSLAMCGVLVDTGRAEDASLLLGAADEAARRMLLEEMPGDVAENTAIRERVRDAAGVRFHEWYERGRTLPLEAALTVLEDPDAG